MPTSQMEERQDAFISAKDTHVKFLENFLKFPLKQVGVGDSMTLW